MILSVWGEDEEGLGTCCEQEMVIPKFLKESIHERCLVAFPGGREIIVTSSFWRTPWPLNGHKSWYCDEWI